MSQNLLQKKNLALLKAQNANFSIHIYCIALQNIESCLEGGDHVVGHVLEGAADLDEGLVYKLDHFCRNVGFKLQVIVQVHCSLDVPGLVLSVNDVPDIGHKGVHSLLGHHPVTEDAPHLAPGHAVVTDCFLQEHDLGQGGGVDTQRRDGFEGDQTLTNVIILHATRLDSAGQVKLNGLGGAGSAASNNVLQCLDLGPADIILVVEGLVHPDGDHHVVLSDLGVVPSLEDGLFTSGFSIILQHAEVLHGLGEMEGLGALLAERGQDHEELGAVLGGDAAC